MRFQILAARIAFAALLLAAAMAAVAVGSVRLGLAPLVTGLTLMAGATALGLVALLCALTWLFQALKHNQGDPKRIGLVALFGSLVLLTPSLHAVYHQLTAPAIIDASSDPDDAPQFVALAKLRTPQMNPPAYDGGQQLQYRGETNTAAYMLHTYYTDLTKPKAYLLMTKSKLFWRAYETARRCGWTIIDSNAAEGRIEATARSFWFGEISDIVIRVRTAGAIGARIDARSQSRSAKKDFGGNIRRLEFFFARLRD